MQAVAPTLKNYISTILETSTDSKSTLDKRTTLKPTPKVRPEPIPEPGLSLTPLREMSNGRPPTSFTAFTPLKGWPRGSPSADKKGGGDAIEDRLADSISAKTAAGSDSKENRPTAPGALDKKQMGSGVSSRGTAPAFCKGANPPRPLKSKVPLIAARHSKSIRTSASTQVRQPPLQTSSTPLSFSPFRGVKGQLKSGTDRTLAATATTWLNPMFAYPCEPPSSLQLVPRPSFALPEVTEAQALSQTEADSHRNSGAPPRGPSRPGVAASTPTKQRQFSGRTLRNACLSLGHGAGLPTAAEPADALKQSIDITEGPMLASRGVAPTEPSSPSGSTCGAADQAQVLDQGPPPADAPAADSPRLDLGAVARQAKSPVPHQHTDGVDGISHTHDKVQLEPAAEVPDAAEVRAPVPEVALPAAMTTAEQLPDAVAFTDPVHQVLATTQQQQSPSAAVSMGVGSGCSPMLASRDSPVLGSEFSLTPASPSAAPEASDASYAELDAALELGFADSPIPSAGVLKSEASPLLGLGESPMLDSGNSPMPASPSAVSEASNVSYAELDAALELGYADSPIPSAGVLKSEASPLLGLGDSPMLDSGNSPMQAPPSAASEASDASYAELDAALELGFGDSSSPSASVLESVDLCEHLQQMPSVIFGTLCAAPADEQRQGLTSSSSCTDLMDVNIESPSPRMYSMTASKLRVTPDPSGDIHPASACQDELMTSADDKSAWDTTATAMALSCEELAQPAFEHDRAVTPLPFADDELLRGDMSLEAMLTGSLTLFTPDPLQSRDELPLSQAAAIPCGIGPDSLVNAHLEEAGSTTSQLGASCDTLFTINESSLSTPGQPTPEQALTHADAPFGAVEEMLHLGYAPSLSLECCTPMTMHTQLHSN